MKFSIAQVKYAENLVLWIFLESATNIIYQI